MAAEKLAKAFLCGSDNRQPPTTHNTLVRFMRIAKGMRVFRNASGMRQPQFRSFIDGLLPTAEAIEKLVPEGSGVRPNPEYPWETSETVISPLGYDYPMLDLKSLKTQKLLEFIRMCISIA